MAQESLTKDTCEVVGRLDVESFIVRLPNGDRLECSLTEPLKASRLIPAIGDLVRVTRTGTTTGTIYYKVVPIHAFPSDDFRRAELVRKGILKPKGAYDPAAHAPPPLPVPVLPIDHAGKKAAAARVERGGTDRDFERERYGRP